jgi:hypothetical protein
MGSCCQNHYLLYYQTDNRLKIDIALMVLFCEKTYIYLYFKNMCYNTPTRRSS